MIKIHNKTHSDTAVEIAGAGPAGLAAAITLAHAGRQVIVHEAQKEVGHRFGRDFQGLENWTTKKNVFKVFKAMGLSTDFNAPPSDNCIIFDPKGTPYQIKSKEPIFYLVERGPGQGSLDRALLQQAQSLGVEVRFNSRLREIKDKGILATGPKATDAIAVGYHFDTDMVDGYWAICDNKLAPQGYAYLLIASGRGTIKTCMFSDFKNQKLYLQRTVAAFEKRLGLKMRNLKRHGGSGNFHIPKSAYRGSHPMVGEHAGFQDTLWGFGMRLALSSGVLAAQSLINNEDYDRLWQRELKPQMDTAVVNRVLFSLLSYGGFSWFIKQLAARSDLRESLHRQYNLSFMKRLLMPWAKFHYKSRRNDNACEHIDCHCVCCRCIQE